MKKLVALTCAALMVLSMGMMAGCGGAKYKDGTYDAVGTGGKHGDVPVTVKVEGGKITSVELGKNEETPGMVEAVKSDMIPKIIEKNGLEGVDAASGATFTSTAVKDGVTKALEQAK